MKSKYMLPIFLALCAGIQNNAHAADTWFMPAQPAAPTATPKNLPLIFEPTGSAYSWSGSDYRIATTYTFQNGSQYVYPTTVDVALYQFGSGTVTLTDSTLSTSGNGAFGVHFGSAQGQEHGLLTLKNVTVSTTGGLRAPVNMPAYGLLGLNGRLVGDHLTVTTSGANATGIAMSDTPGGQYATKSSLDLTDSSITSLAGSGITMVQDGSRVNLTRCVVSSSGVALGLSALDVTAQVTDSTITGNVQGGRNVAITGTTVKGGIAGFYSSGSTVSPKLSVVSSAVTGSISSYQQVTLDKSGAQNITSSQQVSLGKSTIRGSITGATQATITDSTVGGAILVRDGSLSLVGSTVGGIDPNVNDGNISADNSSVTIKDSRIKMMGGKNVQSTIEKSTLLGLRGTAISAPGGTVKIYDSVISGNTVQAANYVLSGSQQTGNIIGASAAPGTFSLISSQLTGNVSGAKTLTLENSSWVGGTVSTAALSIDAASKWQIPVGFGSKVSALNHAGTISFAHDQGGAYNTVTLDSIAGTGSIELNTWLGGDDSGSDQVLASTAADQIRLKVKNTGGQGAQTKAGILVATGAGNGHNFVLAEPVTAGLFDYALATVGDSYYLQSELATNVVVLPSVPTLALEFSRASVATYKQRMGAYDYPTKAEVGRAWLRSWAKWGQKDSSYDYSAAGAEVGVDLVRCAFVTAPHQQAKTFLNAGLSAQGGRAYSHVMAPSGAVAGTVDHHAYGIGSYASLAGVINNDYAWYLDATVKLSRLDTRANPIGKSSATVMGWDLSHSIEAGIERSMYQGATSHATIGLQAQGIITRLAMDDSASVSFDSHCAELGRVGMQLAWQNKRFGLMLNGNAWATKNAKDTTHIVRPDGSYELHSDLGNSWGEVEAEAQYKVTKSTSLWAAAGYERGFDGSRDAWTGRFGVRILWR